MRKSIALICALLMTVPVGLLLAPAGAESAPAKAMTTSPRADVNLIDIYTQGNYDQNLYPGESTSFYIYLVTLYSGGLFAGPNATFNSSYLNNLTLYIDGITDTNLNPVANEPIVWEQPTIQNNSDKGYYMGSPGYGLYLYADNLGNSLKMTVKTDNVPTGQFYIRIREEANVMTQYVNATTMQFAHIINYDYFYFRIESCVGPYNNWKYTLQGYSENWNGETLYAGAQNQKVGIGQVYAYASGTFTDIYGDLAIMDTHFRLINRTVYLTRLDMPMIWRMDIARGTPAGYYDIGMKLTYKRDGVLINEAWTTQTITIAYTPFLSFPDNKNMQEPVARVKQNTPNATFDVTIRNDGNVDLKGLTARLNLDRASYFVNGNIYWNEGSWASTNTIPVSVTVGEIKVGAGATVQFSDVILKNNLPPGKYFVPIVYTGTYYSNGSMGSSGDVVTSDNDYRAITDDINYPETGSQTPGIFVLVEEDARGIELEGQISGTYYPVSKNNYFQLQVLNRERYTFTDVKYTVHTDGGSPLKNQGAPDSDLAKTLPPAKRYYLYGSSNDYLYYYADIKDIATPGVRSFTVDFEGYNPYMVKVMTSFDVSITIGALQPTLQTIRNTVDVTPGGVGIVNVTVKNFGQGAARNVSLYFKPSSSGIKYNDDYIPLGDLRPEETKAFTFSVSPNTPQQTIYGTFYGTLYYQYTDDSGNTRKMFSGPSESINFVFLPKMPDFVITKVSCPPVAPKTSFKVTVTVTNVGGSAAENVSVMVMNPNAIFNVKGSGTVSLGNIALGESKDVPIDFTSANELPSDTAYSMTLYFSYKRAADGNALTFGEGDRESFTVRTKEEVQTTRQEQVVTYKGGTSNQMDMGAVILGVLILVGMVILAMVFRRPPSPPLPLPPPMPQQAPPSYQPPGPPQRGIPTAQTSPAPPLVEPPR